MQIELENDSFVFTGSSFVSAMPGTTSGAFIPQVQQVSDDLDGVHKCDHTRGVDTEQLDDGVDHTFVSYQSTIDMHLRGGSSFSGS